MSKDSFRTYAAAPSKHYSISCQLFVLPDSSSWGTRQFTLLLSWLFVSVSVLLRSVKTSFNNHKKYLNICGQNVCFFVVVVSGRGMLEAKLVLYMKNYASSPLTFLSVTFESWDFSVTLILVSLLTVFWSDQSVMYLDRLTQGIISNLRKEERKTIHSVCAPEDPEQILQLFADASFWCRGTFFRCVDTLCSQVPFLTFRSNILSPLSSQGLLLLFAGIDHCQKEGTRQKGLTFQSREVFDELKQGK